MKMWPFFSITSLIVLIDQLSKLYIRVNIPLNTSIPIVRGIFRITHVENSGAAFGLLQNQTMLFIIVSFLTIALIFFYWRHIPRSTGWVYTALALVAGGAIGNLIDRIHLGKVVDFFDFGIWPVFNVADAAIVIGVVILLFISMFESSKNLEEQGEERR